MLDVGDMNISWNWYKVLDAIDDSSSRCIMQYLSHVASCE